MWRMEKWTKIRVPQNKYIIMNETFSTDLYFSAF